ncbi:DUF1330 domain-containing protein [Pseudomonas sp. BMS12]|uniref:DUF1330 domain-containing protein n=1 Tax=Pseudomonas sp. BMS12 TaxID=1796033 RepID=UPI00083A52AB|nr:DUF1330 domain-containing protein [Pseudomonas sp. BMS12]
MPSLNPSHEQLAEFAARMPAGQPILMLNLLRYNADASYPQGSEHAACSGREAYKRYSRTAIAKVQGVGGRVEILAPVQVALIAPPGESWDEMLLVRYPSPEAFLAMISDPEYQAATVHRTAALADSRLIGTTPPTA